MSRNSFVECAPDCDFPLQNLPFGVFSHNGYSPRVGAALGDYVIDLAALQGAGLFCGPELTGRSLCFSNGSLNEFMGLGRSAWREVRESLMRLFSSAEGIIRDDEQLQEKVLIHKANVQMHLPAQIGDYTDFYASREHATNVGTMFRGADKALQPNWVHLPVGYHGRSSSIVVSGTDVKRPKGQMPPTEGVVDFGPSKMVDFELEMGAFMGPGNELGESISVDDAMDHIFGLVLMNDWSARDIQKWEYVPLGPFNGKNWATTISPWVVTMDALEPFKCEAPTQSPPVLPYLRERHRSTYDIKLQVDLQPSGRADVATVSNSNLRKLYWTFPQMVAHHTAGGCNLRSGDLLGTGTISSETEDGLGSMLELCWSGARPCNLRLGNEVLERKSLHDGDSVILRGWCQGSDYRIGFGECCGKIV
ncbi:hypothetical protein BSKO_10788 [Bryopsis sp. KO-2023]|nr:hypothetical protein BSKO_10788 [Bryopsis sp. KO-2023]